MTMTMMMTMNPVATAVPLVGPAGSIETESQQGDNVLYSGTDLLHSSTSFI